MHRATDAIAFGNPSIVISIHALYTEGDAAVQGVQPPGRYFNPRPLCRGRLRYIQENCPPFRFQSTPSMQRATVAEKERYDQITISIHALYAEGDVIGWASGIFNSDFNPRPLCRGRPGVPSACLRYQLFQSTPSMQRATWSARHLWRDFRKFQSTPSMQRATLNASTGNLYQ